VRPVCVKPKKDNKRLQTVANWVFAQITHDIGLRYSCVWWVPFRW